MTETRELSAWGSPGFAICEPITPRPRSQAIVAKTGRNRFLGWMCYGARQLRASAPHRRAVFLSGSVNGRAVRAWKAAGLAPIGMHEARHTFASLMIWAGVNAKALATYMGHSTVTITYDRYGHLMSGNEDEAAGLLDGYLDRARSARAVMS